MSDDKRMVIGSVGQIMQVTGKSLAQTWMNVDYIAMCDVSTSMDMKDGQDGQSRHDRMKKALKGVQMDHPGKVAVASFSDEVELNINGIPSPTVGGTNLKGAIEWAISKKLDQIGIKMIVISDGEPDDAGRTLEVAKRWRTTIDIIYIGPDGGSGRDFLRALSKQTGGTFIEDTGAKLLEASVNKLMLLGSGK